MAVPSHQGWDENSKYISNSIYEFIGFKQRNLNTLTSYRKSKIGNRIRLMYSPEKKKKYKLL